MERSLEWYFLREVALEVEWVKHGNYVTDEMIWKRIVKMPANSGWYEDVSPSNGTVCHKIAVVV